MKQVLLALLMIGVPFLARAADAPAMTFYVELIRGSDQDVPPTPDAHEVGVRLYHRLHDVFRWKNYWEVKRENVSIRPGEKARVRITKEREVEIDLSGSKDMTVSIYADGKLTRKRQQSLDTAFYIAGGSNDATDPWFIVVRRDNPDANPGLAAMP